MTLASVCEPMSSKKLSLVFVCTHNRCRSILGEAIFRQICGDSITVQSAGSQPAGQVHPATLQALTHHQFATHDLASLGIDELQNPDKIDAYITVCDSAANEACVYLGQTKAAIIHHSLPDPTKVLSHEQHALFERVINQLAQQAQALAKTLEAQSALSAKALESIFNKKSG